MPTYVYVANAEDGEIAAYRLTGAGELITQGRAKAAVSVAPLAVSPDRRRLYAAVRAKPFSVHVFGINPSTGALAPHSVSPLAESFPYLSLDRTGRLLFGASYGGHLVSVNEVGSDGRVAAEARQVIPVGRNAHAILADRSNRFVFVPCLGTDQIFPFALDSGTLRPGKPVQMKAGTGPRHLAFSRDNRFVYVLSELLGSVTTFSQNDGVLTEISTTPMVTGLRAGAPRGPDAPPRERENDVWAADIHLSPDGRFLYTSERTSNSLCAFSVDAATGKLAWMGATPTEKQPRGFAIDPQGKFLVSSGEKSTTVSVHAIDAGGSLGAARQFPGGKGGNWVEIVAF
ncbi:MAG TPA: beta-propeller fold lactonase family protein [Burkholderiales bacterium]|nr:beta-propeller fold lactonase family protein [Burkholderiales bacterium]